MQDKQFTPYGWPDPSPRYLEPTPFLDFENPVVARFVRDATEGAGARASARCGCFMRCAISCATTPIPFA